MHSRHSRSALEQEKLLVELEQKLQLSREKLLILLADTLANALLTIQASDLQNMLATQTNKIVFRKLRSILDTLQKIGFINFRS